MEEGDTAGKTTRGYKHEERDNGKGDGEEEGEDEEDVLSKKSFHRKEDEGAEYPDEASVGSVESDGEKSLDLPDSPRPLSQETRNLTASELLLNKSVDLFLKKKQNNIRGFKVFLYLLQKWFGQSHQSHISLSFFQHVWEWWDLRVWQVFHDTAQTNEAGVCPL